MGGKLHLIPRLPVAAMESRPFLVGIHVYAHIIEAIDERISFSFEVDRRTHECLGIDKPRQRNFRGDEIDAPH
jgi:hypothetical protein